MSHVGQSSEVRHAEPRVTNTLNVYQLCLFVNGFTEILGVV